MTDELTPRQNKFLKNYLDPKSKTFSNAYQSALDAGFSKEYAKTILSQDIDWLSENLRDSKLVVKALKNLGALLESEDEKVMADLTKFTLSRLNKAKFGDKLDITSDGEKLPTPILEITNVPKNDSNEEDSSTNEED